MQEIVSEIAYSLIKYIDDIRDAIKLSAHELVQIKKIILVEKSVNAERYEILIDVQPSLGGESQLALYLHANNLTNQFEQALKIISSNIMKKFNTVQIVNEKVILYNNKIEIILTLIIMNQVLPTTYEEIVKAEDFIRDHMYDPSFQNHEMNTNLYYDLIEIDETGWNNLVLNPVNHSPDMLFTERAGLTKQPWDTIQSKLRELSYVFTQPGFFVAGGKIFSILFGTPSHDTDIFMYNDNYENMITKIHNFTQTMRPDVSLLRSKNAVSYTYKINEGGRWPKQYDIQLILRKYKSPSEILHGFDVDNSSIGYDGKHIYMTKRALFAITNGYNTVNFDRLSSSYEYRLVKYATRGMAIKVPNFDRSKVNTESLMKQWDDYMNKDIRYSTDLNDKYRSLKHLKGLDLLLFMEYHLNQYNYNLKVINSYEKLAEEKSDYSLIPLAHYGQRAPDLFSLLDYLLSEQSEERYPELYERYKDLLSLARSEYGDYPMSIDNVLHSKQINFIKLNQLSSGGSHLIFNITDDLYKGLEIIRPWNIPQDMELKTINPGEQMTGTFHKTVFSNPSLWYQGIFYTI